VASLCDAGVGQGWHPDFLFECYPNLKPVGGLDQLPKFPCNILLVSLADQIRQENSDLFVQLLKSKMKAKSSVGPGLNKNF
jgi:hypothetical protein